VTCYFDISSLWFVVPHCDGRVHTVSPASPTTLLPYCSSFVFLLYLYVQYTYLQLILSSTDIHITICILPQCRYSAALLPFDVSSFRFIALFCTGVALYHCSLPCSFIASVSVFLYFLPTAGTFWLAPFFTFMPFSYDSCLCCSYDFPLHCCSLVSASLGGCLNIFIPWRRSLTSS